MARAYRRWANWSISVSRVILVEKSGAWFSYDGQRIGQGRENAKIFMRDNPEVAKKLENAIRTQQGVVANALLVGPGSAEEAAEASLDGPEDEAAAGRKKKTAA